MQGSQAPTAADRQPGSVGGVHAGDSLLQVENARLGYQLENRFHLAVQDVSFDLSPAETVILLGPSGCGKSTLLKSIAGFLDLSRGSISLRGRRTVAPGPDRAVVFQEFDQLFAWRTVLDNVAYPLRRNGRSKAEAAASAKHYLEMMGLSGAVDRFPHQLSGGMKQRVSIAVVLRKAAEQQLGDAHALDTNIVSFAHPDGLQALTSGQVDGHLASPPFEFEEQQQGAHVVTRSYDLFGGPHTFNGVFTTSKFYNANTGFSQKLFTDLQDAVQQINSNPDKAAQALSEESGGKVEPAKYKTWITDKAITYTVTPHSLMAFATFMKAIGIIKKIPGSWKDLVFPTVQNLQGS